MFIFCDAVQAVAAARRARGQNVFVADLFSAVNGNTMLNSDGTHPNSFGRSAIASEHRCSGSPPSRREPIP